MDIVTPFEGGQTGYLATTEEQYADAIAEICALSKWQGRRQRGAAGASSTNLHARSFVHFRSLFVSLFSKRVFWGYIVPAGALPGLRRRSRAAPDPGLCKAVGGVAVLGGSVRPKLPQTAGTGHGNGAVNFGATAVFWRMRWSPPL